MVKPNRLLDLLSLGTWTSVAIASSCKGCLCIPRDDCWPTKAQWAKLNETVGGRLVASMPVASVCHGDTYDEDACAALKKGWDLPQPYISSSSDIMSPFWQNQSCDPFTDKSSACTLGNSVSYSIAVAGPDDIRAGINFARDHKVRLVVRNTGHDYLGRSTGTGGLALWTHALNTTRIVPDYKSEAYSGAAVVIGAGVLSADAYAAAHQQGLRVVGGSCPSVGIAGGYTQGGGHSFLSSMHGLAADNVLEWEAVTASGDHVVAAPHTEHADLYWALSGGGGGNYAVVLSMTVRAHLDSTISGAYLAFDAPSPSSDGLDRFWALVAAFQALLPAVTDAGATALYQIDDGKFVLYSLTAPGLPQSSVLALLAPLTTAMDAAGEAYTLVPTSAPSYYDHFAAIFGPLPYGPLPVSDVLSSRLIPRSVVQDKPDELIAVMRSIVKGGEYRLGMMALHTPTDATARSDNAVLPAWRNAQLQCIVTTPWNWTLPRAEMLARKANLATRIVPELEALTPGSGTYMNEAMAGQEGWAKEFFGDNYSRLLGVKRKYDPRGVFYADSAVGSEGFRIDGEGRLCRNGEGRVHEEL